MPFPRSFPRVPAEIPVRFPATGACNPRNTRDPETPPKIMGVSGYQRCQPC